MGTTKKHIKKPRLSIKCHNVLNNTKVITSNNTINIKACLKSILSRKAIFDTDFFFYKMWAFHGFNLMNHNLIEYLLINCFVAAAER